MQGQWIGRITGEIPGQVVINLDKSGNYVCGTAYLFPDDSDAPGSMAIIGALPDGELKYVFECEIRPINGFGHILDPQSADFRRLYPDYQHSKKCKISLNIEQNAATVQYETDVPSSGTGSLKLQFTNQNSGSPKKASLIDWSGFKTTISSTTNNERQSVIYRGQPCFKKLRTKFHRTNRKDLRRFKAHDVPQLQRYLSTSVKHHFDLNDPYQLGAFYHLVQHHGYPTPLLDWTYSPYVAAFFAFNTVNPDEDEFVTIFSFEKASWCTDLIQIDIIDGIRPHFSIIELLGIENVRMIPQQALAALTNVDDIESYIEEYESKFEKTYLSVYKLRADSKTAVLRDLEQMGITEASMFPGIDSTCKYLSRLNFE